MGFLAVLTVVCADTHSAITAINRKTVKIEVIAESWAVKLFRFLMELIELCW